MRTPRLPLALLAVPLLFAASPAFSDESRPKCGDPRASAYIDAMYGPIVADRAAEVQATAFDEMGPGNKAQMCFQVQEALARYDQTIPHLRREFAQMERLQGQEAWPPLERFSQRMYDLLPIVRFNPGNVPGYEPVGLPAANEPLDKQKVRLAKIAEHFKAFDQQDVPEPGIEPMWTAAEGKIDEVAQAVASRSQRDGSGGDHGEGEEEEDGKQSEVAQAGASVNAGILTSAHGAGSNGRGFFDQGGGAGGLGDIMPGGRGMGSIGRGAFPTTLTTASGGPAASRSALPQLEPGAGGGVLPPIKPRDETLQRIQQISAPERDSVAGSGADYGKASLDLINHYGSGSKALAAVMEARGGDYNETAFPARVEAFENIREVTGIDLKDPRYDSSIDYDLMHLDHWLNAYGGVRQGSLAPEDDDGWFKRKGKTLGRSVMAVGGSVITIAYEGTKAFDQTFGTGVGETLGGYDFNADNCSKASWAGLWAGLKGTWYGAYEEIPEDDS